MKKLFMLLSLIITTMAHAGYVYNDYPTISVGDAMGGSKHSIKKFCMTEDESTLIANLKLCTKAKHIGRGYKECEKEEYKTVQIANSFSRRWYGARGTERGYNYDYDRNLTVNVVEFHHRAGTREVIDSFEYQIPTCN